MLFMGFEQMEDPSDHISFGTTMERPLFPMQIAPDRFGNEMNPARGVKDVGPGQYENEMQTTFTKWTKPLSQKGYVLGARLAQRVYYPNKDRVPSPTHYQSDIERPVAKPSFKSFNASASRFPPDSKEVRPGPGTYEPSVERNRNVQMLHSFGGRTHVVPHVDLKCVAQTSSGATASIKCESCNQAPVGDFYECKETTLCSRCYEYNFKWQEKYTRAFLASFNKARDCSFMHIHEGTTAKIQKMSERDIKKLQRKESYLSLYWP